MIRVKLVLVLCVILAACGGGGDDEIPTVEELQSMTKKQGSEEFERFMEMVEEYEKQNLSAE